MESEVNNEITDIVEYVQARDFKTVSDVMVKRAEEVGYTLNSIKYVLTIVETLS
jgi:plasmid replication initiation protein